MLKGTETEKSIGFIVIIFIIGDISIGRGPPFGYAYGGNQAVRSRSMLCVKSSAYNRRILRLFYQTSSSYAVKPVRRAYRVFVQNKLQIRSQFYVQ